MIQSIKSRMGSLLMSSVLGATTLLLAFSFNTADVHAQQRLDSPTWSIEAGSNTWFLNDNNTRGFTFNEATGNLIVFSRSGGLKPVIVSGATGDSLGVLSVEGIAGGTFPASLIDVSPDGRIFAANLTTNATASDFKIYSWANESANPKLIYSGNVNETALRFGDSFRADFTDGASILLAGGSSNPNLAVFTYDATEDVVSGVNVLAFNAADMRAVRGISSIAGEDSLWINEFDFNLRKVNPSTGVFGTTVPETVFPTKESLWVDHAVINGNGYAAVFPSNLTAAGQSVSIIDLSTATEIAFTAAGPNGNANGTGGGIFDAESQRLFVLATNNSIASYDISALVGGGSSVNVTFTVNTSTIADTVSVNDLIQIRGSLNGAENDDINWGATSVRLNNVGGDYWQTTLSMSPGDRLEHKIYTANRGADGSWVDHAGGGWEGGDNKVFEVPADASGDIAVPVMYFNRQAPFEVKSDSVALFFRVNVGNQVATGSLNPETATVGVRGSASFLDWGETKVVLNRENMPDGSRNVFYSGAAYVDPAIAGEAFEYKYVFEQGDAVNWDDGDNRQGRVTASDSTFHYAFFQGRRPPTADLVTASVQFAVNVGVLEEFGVFNRAIGDEVKIRGGFNGWGEGDMTYSEAFDAWTSAVTLTEEVGARLAYKYYIKWDESRNDSASPNFIPNLPGGWEEPGAFGGGDRIYTFTNETVQTVEDFGSGIQYFNSIPPQGIIRETLSGEDVMNVTFRVDMSAATSHSTPFNPATDTLYLVIQTPLFGVTQGLAVGDDSPIFNNPDQLERVMFSQVGTTNEFELVLPVQLPTENHIGFVLAFVTADGERILNGAGFAAGRRYYRYVQPLNDEDPDNIIWPDSFELSPIVWKATDLDFEAPPTYGLTSTSIRETLEQPTAYVLHNNFPNPFNPTTNISFTIPVTENVQLNVYNVLGQRVATLVDGMMTAGTHSVNFNAANLASGVYIYQLRTGSFTQSRTMMLVK